MGVTYEHASDSNGVEWVTVVVGQGDGTCLGCIGDPVLMRLDLH